MIRIAFLLVLLFLQAGRLHARPDPVAATNGTLIVMTYNLRYASSNPAEAWKDRRPLMRDLLRQTSPDLIGTQEGLYEQLKDIDDDLPDHTWIGLGRDGGSRGEFMAVFYRTARFNPLAFDHFWLSDTPLEIGSSSWGNSNRRMVTWVKFLDRATAKEFYFFNTHFDHQIEEARQKSAALVRERIGAVPKQTPVLLVGDFNTPAGGSRAFEILTKDSFLIDAWSVARERRGDGVGTFNGFKQLVPGGPRIDWILFRGDISVELAETVTITGDGKFPSDHCPVMARVRLN